LNKEHESVRGMVEGVLKWLIYPVGLVNRSWHLMPRITAHELCVAISIKGDCTSLDPDAIPSVEEIMIHSSSFLRLSQCGNHVEFAHFTVEEYLRSIDTQERPDLARYRWDVVAAITYQVETCLDFLTLNDFRPNLCETLDSLQQFLQTHPFYDRASVLWNASFTESRSSERAVRSLKRLFDPHSNTSVFDNWLRIRFLASRSAVHAVFDRHYGRDEDVPRTSNLAPEYSISADDFASALAVAAGTSKLHIAAMFNLVDLIPQSFETRPQLNSISAFGTPLHCALTGYDAMNIAMGAMWPFHRKPDVDLTGLSSTIALLVDLGADVGVLFHTDSRILTPLFLATWCSKTEQLLEAGAVLDQATVRLIMDHSRAYDNFDLAPFARTSLESIGDNDRLCVAQFLQTIAPGRQLIAPNPTAFPHTTLVDLETTLRDAFRRGQLPICRWILEGSDIDVNHEFLGGGETMLHIACSEFASEILKYLVGKGADVSKRDYNGHSCLWHYFDASLWCAGREHGHFRALRPSVQQDCLATLRIILDSKAQLAEDHKSALMLWAECQSDRLESLEGALRLLLTDGADLGSRSPTGQTVWHRLVIEDRVGHSRMLKRCVEPAIFKSTIEVADNEGFTPFFTAIQSGSDDMFCFLLEQGCDLTSTTHKGDSGLYLAAANMLLDDHRMFRILLPKFLHTGIAASSFDGSTLAHAFVNSIACPHGMGKIRTHTSSTFKESIGDLTASSISITDTNSDGETPLDQLCRWIATEGHHGRLDCFHCTVCFESFEVLVAHEHQNYEQLQGDVTWTTILLRGLVAQVSSGEDRALNYPNDTVCSLAIRIAIDRGIPSDKLSAELDLDSIFEIAAMLGQESLILGLLETPGTDVDRPARNAPHCTPLETLCMYCGPTSTIKLAASRSREPGKYNDLQGSNLLHLLLRNKRARQDTRTASIQVLLDAGVNVNEQTNDTGRTALMMAAAEDFDDGAVQMLLGGGANVELLDSKGWTALLHACSSGTDSAIKALIDAGSPLLHANVYWPCSPWDGKILCGPIHLAAARGMTDIVKVFLELERDVDMSEDSENHLDPLLMACLGDQEMVRLLLKHGHDPNCLDPSTGMRPLHVASWIGSTHIVQTLLEAGGMKEALDGFGCTAWMVASLQGHTDVANIIEQITTEHLVQSGSSVRQLCPMQQQPDCAMTIHVKDQSSIPAAPLSTSDHVVQIPRYSEHAVRSRHSLPADLRKLVVQGSLRVVQDFAESGIDMRGCFENCTCTPMSVAVNYKWLEIVTFLVSIQVPLSGEDKCSVHRKHNARVLQLLATKPIWTRTVEQWFHRDGWRAQLSCNDLLRMIATAIQAGNPNTLHVLLSEIAYPFPCCDIDGWGIQAYPDEFLHLAAKSAKISAISCATMLLSHGLHVDCLDRYGQTPLHCAAAHGRLKMVELLVSHNATVNGFSILHGTALSIAAEKGHVRVLKRLLASGALPNFCLSLENAPLTRAADHGQYPAFRALLDAGGTPEVQHYYALCREGHRSVLMLDDQYFCALQGPDLLQQYLSPGTALPILRSMPLARRAWILAELGLESTALYCVALGGACRWVDFMTQYGAAINMEGGSEGTPLMAACAAGHLTIAKHLVRSGALLTYWNGTSQVSAFVKAQPHQRLLQWLLVGRFTETRRLTGNSAEEDMHPETTEDRDCEVNVELVLRDDFEGYFEKNFWFVPARRFVDSGDGSFDTVEILPSEFAKYKPGFV
jgi:ankyrin repeat protein